ncbi:MAG: hypothetical protein R3F36_00425 [Candidatus Competibacteraceae bacterium]
MDGLQATRIIKQDPDLNHIPIVALYFTCYDRR